ncbi:MAG: hypothetical protein ABII09_10415 [Planctomycetota bacterium]
MILAKWQDKFGGNRGVYNHPRLSIMGLHMKKYLLFIIEIPLRLSLLTLGIILGWQGLIGFLGIGLEDIVGPGNGGAILALLLAGFALSAAISPRSFWRNGPLKSFIAILLILFLVTAWFVGTVLLAGHLAGSLLKNESPYYGLIIFAMFVACVVVQYILFLCLRRIAIRAGWMCKVKKN